MPKKKTKAAQGHCTLSISRCANCNQYLCTTCHSDKDGKGPQPAYAPNTSKLCTWTGAQNSLRNHAKRYHFIQSRHRDHWAPGPRPRDRDRQRNPFSMVNQSQNQNHSQNSNRNRYNYNQQSYESDIADQEVFIIEDHDIIDPLSVLPPQLEDGGDVDVADVPSQSLIDISDLNILSQFTMP